MPMPVLDHVRARRYMGVDIESELSVIGWVLVFRIPSDRIGIGLGYQVVGVLQRASVITLIGSTFAVVLVLCGVVRIDRDDVEALCNVALVDLGSRWTGEILRDELIRPLVLIHDRSLPSQKIGGDRLRITLPLELPAGIQNAALNRDLCPVVQPLAPVIQSPVLVEFVNCLELVLQVFNKSGLYVMVGCTGG